MTLKQRIAQLLTDLRPPANSIISPKTKELTSTNGAIVNGLSNRFGSVGSRYQLANACVNAYKTDPRVESVIDTLARDTVKGGFQLNTDSKEATDIASEMLDRLNIWDLLEDFNKEAFNYGDYFRQVGIDDKLNIVQLAPRPCLNMVRLSNILDEFPNPKEAYRWQTTSRSDSPSDIIFPEWEILHVRWNRFAQDQYGRPMLASGLGLWSKIQQAEIDMVNARSTRAGIARLHVIEDGTPEDVETYKNANRSALSQLGSLTHYFSNKKTSMQQMEGASQLPSTDDIEYLLESWFAGSPVPMSLIAYGGNLNGDTITAKEKQYRRSIEQITSWIDRQLLIPLIKLQWLLKGINPLEVTYETTWASKDPLAPADLRDIADSILRLKATGVDEKLIAQLVAKFIPNVDTQELAKQLATAIEDGNEPPSKNSPTGANGMNTNGGRISAISRNGSSNNFDSSRAGSLRKKFGTTTRK